MSKKEYYCSKYVKGKICGEDNPENFIPGRYSTCKNCRKKSSSEIYLSKKLESDKPDENTDLNQEIRSTIEYYLKKAPVMYGNQSIVDCVSSTDENCSDILNNVANLKLYVKEEFENMRRLYDTKIEIQSLEIQSLKMILSQYQNEISDLKKKISN